VNELLSTLRSNSANVLGQKRGMGNLWGINTPNTTNLKAYIVILIKENQKIKEN